MKDLPHHIKKLNRRVIRSMHREEMQQEALPEVPTREVTKSQQKKKAKKKLRDEHLAHVPTDPTPEEKNKKMKKRVPIFDYNNHPSSKGTRSTHKKTPRF